MVATTAELSERAVLAACLNDPQTFQSARLQVDVADFWVPRHEHAWAAMCDLADNGRSADPQALAVELAKRGQLEAWGNGADLIELWRTPPVGDWVVHTGELRIARRVRAVKAECDRLAQALDESPDADVLLDRAAAVSIGLAAAVDEAQDAREVQGLRTWSEFVADRPRAGRWVAPGLLRRGDAVMLLAPPGAGKSTVSRQVCLSLAAGVHPFRPEVTFPPVRTLLVDLENAPDQLAEEAEPMVARVSRLPGWDPSRAMVWPHPEGFDLRTRQGARLLEQAIVQAQPDVLAMGSLFQAYRRGSDDWDTAAEDVQSVLRTLRARYGLALWLEHHSTRSSGGGHSRAPFGGTAWERWPTHGRWLSRADEAGRVYRLEQTFRGDRGARDFPCGLLRGSSESPWWDAIWDEVELDAWVDGRPS